MYCLTSSQNFRKHPGSLKYGWFFGGMVFSRSEWFASVTWKLVTPVVDTDGDGMPDVWEVRYGLNPNDPGDAVKGSRSLKSSYGTSVFRQLPLKKF